MLSQAFASVLSNARKVKWYENGTQVFRVEFYPVFSGGLRKPCPIHHRRHAEAAGRLRGRGVGGI